MLTTRILSALLILASTLLSLSHAQTIRGTVLDDSTSQAIAAAEVSVLDTLGIVVTQTISDSTGRFQVAVTPGDYLFRILRIGYTPTVTTVLHAATDANELSVVIRVPSTSAVVGRDAYALTPIVVEAPPADRYLASFYRHQEMGLGDFADRDEFEQWHPQQVTDVVRRMRGFTILPNAYYGIPLPDGSIDTREYIIDTPGRPHRSAASVECPPLIFLDGGLMGNSQRIDVNTLPLDVIEAVETYSRPIQTPLEYHRPGNDCGVIALWTRTAEPGDLGSPFEFGVRFGGTVAGGPFIGGRLGIHFVSKFVGPLEFYPAVYIITTALSSEQSYENSGWMAHIALRTRIRTGLPLFVGSGLVLVKPDPDYVDRLGNVDIDPAYSLFAGLTDDWGPTRPFLELHLLDFFAPSSIAAQAFMGMGFQF